MTDSPVTVDQWLDSDVGKKIIAAGEPPHEDKNLDLPEVLKTESTLDSVFSDTPELLQEEKDPAYLKSKWSFLLDNNSTSQNNLQLIAGENRNSGSEYSFFAEANGAKDFLDENFAVDIDSNIKRIVLKAKGYSSEVIDIALSGNIEGIKQTTSEILKNVDYNKLLNQVGIVEPSQIAIIVHNWNLKAINPDQLEGEVNIKEDRKLAINFSKKEIRIDVQEKGKENNLIRMAGTNIDYNPVNGTPSVSLDIYPPMTVIEDRAKKDIASDRMLFKLLGLEIPAGGIQEGLELPEDQVKNAMGLILQLSDRKLLDSRVSEALLELDVKTRLQRILGEQRFVIQSSQKKLIERIIDNKLDFQGNRTQIAFNENKNLMIGDVRRHRNEMIFMNMDDSKPFLQMDVDTHYGEQNKPNKVTNNSTTFRFGRQIQNGFETNIIVDFQQDSTSLNTISLHKSQFEQVRRNLSFLGINHSLRDELLSTHKNDWIIVDLHKTEPNSIHVSPEVRSINEKFQNLIKYSLEPNPQGLNTQELLEYYMKSKFEIPKNLIEFKEGRLIPTSESNLNQQQLDFLQSFQDKLYGSFDFDSDKNLLERLSNIALNKSDEGYFINISDETKIRFIEDKIFVETKGRRYEMSAIELEDFKKFKFSSIENDNKFFEELRVRSISEIFEERETKGEMEDALIEAFKEWRVVKREKSGLGSGPNSFIEYTIQDHENATKVKKVEVKLKHYSSGRLVIESLDKRVRIDLPAKNDRDGLEFTIDKGNHNYFINQYGTLSVISDEDKFYSTVNGISDVYPQEGLTGGIDNYDTVARNRLLRSLIQDLQNGTKDYGQLDLVGELLLSAKEESLVIKRGEGIEILTRNENIEFSLPIEERYQTLKSKLNLLNSINNQLEVNGKNYFYIQSGSTISYYPMEDLNNQILSDIKGEILKTTVQAIITKIQEDPTILNKNIQVERKSVLQMIQTIYQGFTRNLNAAGVTDTQMHELIYKMNPSDFHAVYAMKEEMLNPDQEIYKNLFLIANHFNSIWLLNRSNVNQYRSTDEYLREFTVLLNQLEAASVSNK